MDKVLNVKRRWVILFILYIFFVSCTFCLIYLNCLSLEYLYLFIVSLSIPFVYVFREKEYFYMRYLPISLYILEQWMLLTDKDVAEAISGITGSLMDWERLAFVTVSFICAMGSLESEKYSYRKEIKKAFLFVMIYGLVGIIKSGYLVVYKETHFMDRSKIYEWAIYTTFTVTFYLFNALILMLDDKSEHINV